MFHYFVKNNGFTEDLWLITEAEFFFFSNVLLLMYFKWKKAH